jgi:hypothetical protein
VKLKNKFLQDLKNKIQNPATLTKIDKNYLLHICALYDIDSGFSYSANTHTSVSEQRLGHALQKYNFPRNES